MGDQGVRNAGVGHRRAVGIIAFTLIGAVALICGLVWVAWGSRETSTLRTQSTTSPTKWDGLSERRWRVMASIHVNDSPEAVRFLVDTGSPDTLLDMALARKVGVRWAKFSTTLMTGSGLNPVTPATGVVLRVNGWRTIDTPVLCTTMFEGLYFEGERKHGILGRPTLESIYWLDPVSGSLIDPLKDDFTTSDVVDLAADFSGTHITVTGNIMGLRRPVRLAFDSGSMFDLVLSQHLANELIESGYARLMEPVEVWSGRTTTRPGLSVPEVTIGGHVFKTPFGSSKEMLKGPDSRPIADGLIGLGAFGGRAALLLPDRKMIRLAKLSVRRSDGLDAASKAKDQK